MSQLSLGPSRTLFIDILPLKISNPAVEPNSRISGLEHLSDDGSLGEAHNVVIRGKAFLETATKAGRSN
jgi:hypothetical protein